MAARSTCCGRRSGLGSINATTDRFWAVEVDFDAALDELFSITTSKQQVTAGRTASGTC